jgi:dTMP kinase
MNPAFRPQPHYLGRLITFEGIDGAGKSSHLLPLADALRAQGREVILTREPGGAPLAEELRTLMLGHPMQGDTELLLAFAARSEHLHQVIRPALARGAWVLCDRFTDSTYAYQGGGRGLPWDHIAMLEQLVHGDLQPSLTLWFDLEPALAAQRRQAARSADRFESEDLAFFKNVRAGYLRRAKEHPQRVVRIDSEEDFAFINRQLQEIVLSH